MISILVSDPLWSSNVKIFEDSPTPESYSHTIQAYGGFDRASLSLSLSKKELEDWIESGLGRHIVVRDGLGVVWEGFVNNISGSFGSLSIQRGPLLDISNRVAVSYSTCDYSVQPPVVGVTAYTDDADDTDSQALYGIIPIMLSCGSASLTMAEEYRDTFLETRKLPKTTKGFGQGSSDGSNVSLECLGYFHWLNWLYFNAATGEQNASDKILAVLADTPNSTWLTYGTDNIDTNTLQVPQNDTENRFANTVIQDIVVRGDASQNRWLFGIYEDQEAYYEQSPSAYEYTFVQMATRGGVESFDYYMEIAPWLVRPGKWLFLRDYLAGRSHPTSPRDDERSIFIESVTYTAPDGLSVTGGNTDTLGQMMAQMGLGGVAS